MTEAELKAIEDRATAAASGPWMVFREDRVEDGTKLRLRRILGSYLHHYDVGGERGLAAEADAEFLAHARVDVPALVAEVRFQRSVAREVAEKCAAAEAKARTLRGLVRKNMIVDGVAMPGSCVECGEFVTAEGLSPQRPHAPDCALDIAIR